MVSPKGNDLVPDDPGIINCTRISEECGEVVVQTKNKTTTPLEGEQEFLIRGAYVCKLALIRYETSPSPMLIKLRLEHEVVWPVEAY